MGSCFKEEMLKMWARSARHSGGEGRPRVVGTVGDDADVDSQSLRVTETVTPSPAQKLPPAGGMYYARARLAR